MGGLRVAPQKELTALERRAQAVDRGATIDRHGIHRIKSLTISLEYERGGERNRLSLHENVLLPDPQPDHEY